MREFVTPTLAGMGREEAARRSADERGHPLLRGLTVEQCDAVTTSASPVCIIAGAGSGKTRVLTRRIAWQVEQRNADPRRMLAVTFTRRAARELRSRLRTLGLRDAVKAGTFHAIALAQVRRHAEDSSRSAPRILETPRKLITELRSRSDTAAIASLVNEINWAQARLIEPQQYAEAASANGRRITGMSAQRFATLYDDYEALKSQRRLLDFNDMLAEATRLMGAHPEHARVQRWLHQHLLVDEFQDINPLQFALLKAWLGPDTILVIVGDPDQAIYGWNGSDPQLMNDVARHFRGCAVLHLQTNFRSTPEILAAAAHVLNRPPQPAARPSGNPPTLRIADGADDPEFREGERGRAPSAQRAPHLEQARHAGGSTEKPPDPHRRRPWRSEAAMLADAVLERHHSSAPWSHQAVLARTNEQLAPLRRALQRRKIPVSEPRDQRWLQRSALIKTVDDWPTHAGLASYVADIRYDVLHAAPSLRPADASGPAPARPRRAPAAQTRSGVAAEHSPPSGHSDLERLLELADDHLAIDSGATVGSFLALLRSGEAPERPYDGVQLLTFHSAKGLEWPIVHIVGLEEGFVPISRARTAAALAEERRLLYVAITRATDELHLMWCDRRSVKGESIERRPSRWLNGIAAASAPTRLDPAQQIAAVTRARENLPPRRADQAAVASPDA